MGLFSKRPKYALSDILKGLQDAVNGVQEMLQAQQVQNLKRFWQETDGSPVCQKVKIGNKEIDVPLVSLVSHNHLEMDYVEVMFKARIADVESHSVVNRLNGKHSVSYAGLQMELDDLKATDPDMIDITVRFKLKDDMEGVNQLAHECNKSI